MRQRWFLFALLVAVVVGSAVLVPLSIAVIVRNQAGARGRSLVTKTRRRLVAAGASIARRFRTATVS